MAKRKELIRFSLELVIIVAVTATVCTKIVVPVKIQGDSMYPTLHDKDTLIVNKLYLNRSDIKRFDIVVLKSDKLNQDIIKRVIGLPGDNIVFKDDKHRGQNYGYRKHLGDQKAQDAYLLSPKAEPGQAVGGRYGKNDRDRRTAQRNDHAVAKGLKHIEIAALKLRRVGIRIQHAGEQRGRNPEDFLLCFQGGH